jgi:hypothetical protein
VAYRGFFGRNLRERDHLGDTGINGMGLQEVGVGVMDWIELAQDRENWWTIVNAVMKLRVP